MNWMLFFACFTVFFEVAHPFPTGTPPSFNYPLEDQVVSAVDAGGSQIGFSLTCDVSGDPAPVITWYRGEEQLSGETGKTLTINPPISDSDATVSGVEYFCIANSSTFGTIRSRTATVQRSSFPTAQWETAGSNVTDARTGFGVVIPCNPPSTAVPTPTVAWESKLSTSGDDTYATITLAPLTNTNPSMRFQLTPEGDLIIHKLESADFDRTYRCSVTNANVHKIVASGRTHTLNAVATLPPSPNDDDNFNGIHVFYRRERVMADRGEPFVVIEVVAPADANQVDAVIYNNLDGLTPGSAFQGLYQISNIQRGGVARAIYIEHIDINFYTIGVLNTTVELFDPAEVTGTSGPHQVLTGRPVTLSCTVSAIPDATVRWYKDNMMLSNGTSTTYEITNAQPSDSGMYQCFVSNAHGDGEGSISVQVRDSGTPPSFNSPLEDQVVSAVDAGGTPIGFTLTCDVSGDPAPDITWYRGGQQLSGETGKTLTINPPISDSDASVSGVEYFCIANSSTFGIIRSRTATVRRSSFPTAQWETAGSNVIDARSGFGVVIPCNPPSTAVPTPTVIWESKPTTASDDTYATISTAPLTNTDPSMRFQLTPEGDLIIHRLESADFDRTYRCSVNNANVHTTVASGQTNTLNAVATLPPSPDDHDLSNGIHVFYRRRRVMADRGEPFVVINVVAPADANQVDSVIYNALNGLTPGSAFQGLYQISNIQRGGVARAIYSQQIGININTVGVLNTTVELFDPAQVTDTSGPHQVLTGKSVTLSCTVSGIPVATVRWYKDNVMLSNGTSTTYQITNAQSSDSGMYQCFVSNARGDGEGSISVQVAMGDAGTDFSTVSPILVVKITIPFRFAAVLVWSVPTSVASDVDGFVISVVMVTPSGPKTIQQTTVGKRVRAFAVYFPERGARYQVTIHMTMNGLRSRPLTVEV